ncbi:MULTISPECIES: TetR/AcrR family transcriptional regulator [unclassified Sphingomonas]|uniref:TetR/AcrR family transcriptional regulator n=1 Tax=unclassified Sphingomonas TaxID=196159 RepID=UPI0028564DDE|nr:MULTISPECIES: TetR/AcrR family transcriptional regulator [unclassified Sphingomonas]MDR6116662.1 AcrR family transcriptional regulator [Sphingomonas sp. SORGH_AS_0789]MDR6149661.1 AcrR family transcriptional regulator [Sphingomonas sp. SORGH_AS_0742]
MGSDDKMRSDARGNRARLIAITRDALGRDPLTPLHAIAKLAGVGQGTLYRHFASREALVLAVYQDSIDELAALAPRLLVEHPPLDALRLWTRRFSDYSRKKHGIANMVRAVMSDREFAATYQALASAVRELMQACAGTGALAQPLDADDFLQLLALLTQLPDDPEGTAREARLVEMAFRAMGPALG